MGKGLLHASETQGVRSPVDRKPGHQWTASQGRDRQKFAELSGSGATPGLGLQNDQGQHSCCSMKHWVGLRSPPVGADAGWGDSEGKAVREGVDQGQCVQGLQGCGV